MTPLRPSVPTPATDIGEPWSLEEQLRQIQRVEELRQAVAEIAHDLNNTLIVIGLASSAVRLGLADEPPVSARLTSIDDATSQCAALTRRLMGLSRQDPPRLERCDLGQVFRGSAELARWLLPKDVVLEIDIPRGPIPVDLDRAQFVRVVNNLVCNAADAMPGGGTVSLSVRRDAEGPYALFEVHDDGHGIPEPLHQRVFEPYFSTRGDAGTGLGLAVVRSIAYDHGGSADIDSAVGQGTTVRITLPLAESGTEH
jgi:signal transduction histidine kinase